MSICHYALEVGDPEGGRFEQVEALVDTCATFTVVPADVLQRLGIDRKKKVRSRLADGSAVEPDIGETQVRVDGRVVPTVVVFGEDESPALLGDYTLERALLAVDPVGPVGQRLIPTDSANDLPPPLADGNGKSWLACRTVGSIAVLPATSGPWSRFPGPVRSGPEASLVPATSMTRIRPRPTAPA